jgi:hypothetical protein
VKHDGKRGRSRDDIPRRRCLLSKAVLLTKPEVAVGCAADVMVDREFEESCDESREGSRVRSRGNKTRDLVTELRVRDDGMAGFEWFKIFECGETLTQ